jgi:hypothetical protein
MYIQICIYLELLFIDAGLLWSLDKDCNRKKKNQLLSKNQEWWKYAWIGWFMFMCNFYVSNEYRFIHLTGWELRRRKINYCLRIKNGYVTQTSGFFLSTDTLTRLFFFLILIFLYVDYPFSFNLFLYTWLFNKHPGCLCNISILDS